MWGSRISLKKLIAVCRSLAMTLHSGLPVHRAFDLTARKIGDARCRRELGEVTREIMEGQDVATALRHRDGYFPDLFLDLVDVSEQSGAMPEVLKALAEHYEDLQRLRRSFLGQIIFPILQLVAAILIVALLIFVLGLIASGRANGVEDMLGLGLTGTSGAITWLVLSFGSLGAVFAAYWVVSKVFQQQRALDTILLAVPVIGPCMRSFALARFSWAYALTQQTGMSV